MKISQGIFVVLCIVFAIQFTFVDCDQALGTRINGLSLNTIANRDRLLGGSATGGIANPSASFQIWIKGISTTEFNAVIGAVNGAGCSLISSNINNNALGLPHWNYIVARIRCSTIQKWQTLVYNQAFYSRVAYTERSYGVDASPDTISTNSSSIGSGCKKRFGIPPRIAVWQGKVNQHSIPTGGFATDPDGYSGAELNKLTYCKKWFPQTTGFRDYQQETITGWRDAGNTGGPYSRAVMTTECIQPACNYYTRDVKRNLNEIPQISEKEVESYKLVYENMMRSINEYNSTVQFRLEEEYKRKPLTPLCPIERDLQEQIDAAQTQEEKDALMKRIPQNCQNPPPPPPPPYYPPPTPPPPNNCPVPYIERELQEQIDAAQTQEEKDALMSRIPYGCPPPPPPYVPPPPYIPPSDWQCSQVAENSNAVLTCPSGKVIKKIEFASFGNAASWSGCADGPKPKIGTCHSGNTEYLVHQKCCGQSTCTVPATNAFFIDPCGGTGKTLRIKAVCDYPSKVECTNPICNQFTEGTRVYLGCPSGLTIKSIDFVAWGTVPNLSCQTQFAIPGICYANQDNTKTTISNLCKGKSSCDFTAGNALFGDPCPGQAKVLAIKASCANHEPYIWGFEQSTSTQPTSNYAWESANGRPWTNYLENMGWTSSVDYYNQQYGGTFYLLDLGVYESHPELLDYSVTPPVTRVKRLPNVMNPDPTQQTNGFLDPDLLAIIGEDAYLEDKAAHGTTNAALLVGNTLGLARNVPLYYAKVSSVEIGLETQAFQNAFATVNQLVGTAGHKRPAVVMAPFNFNFGYGYCYADRVYATPQEPTCSQGIMDELATAYEKGTIVVIPSNNGFNFYDIYTNPVTGLYFSVEGVPYPNTRICDVEPISAVPIDTCNSASRVHDMSFNVWDLYMPILEKTTQKPFVVAAHDYKNRLSRWRDIVYSTSDADWNTPWWQIGSSNIGSCVDFSSFGVQISKSAANYWVLEDGHYFPNSYREYPYLISGTSYATATATAVAMYTYGRYGGQSYSGQNIENMRYYMQTYGNRNYDDVDTCRNNYWTINQDGSPYARLKFM